MPNIVKSTVVTAGYLAAAYVAGSIVERGAKAAFRAIKH